MGLPKCHLQNDQHADDDDDDGDDDDDESFVLQRFVVPSVKCLESDNSGGPLRCPAPCFCTGVTRRM